MSPAPGLPLRLLDVLLRVALFLLTVYAGIMAIAVLVGDGGSIQLPGRLDGGYDVRVADGRTFDGGPGGNGWIDRPRPVGDPLVVPRPKLDVQVAVGLDEGEHRYVLAWGLLVSLGFALTVLLSLRRLVGEARSGEPFAAANVRRLRVAGGAILLWPVAARLLSASLNRVIDTDPAATVRWPGPGLWTCVLLGVALLALGEVFRRGVELRELEQATV